MSVVSVARSRGHEESFRLFSNSSILIYLSIAGSLTPMHVMESDSIASVKLRIQASKGFFVKKQKLVFDGRELARNTSCVRDYGVSDGNVLHLVLRLSDLQPIVVRTVCGKGFEFQIERTRNVEYVKQQIAKKGKDFADLKDQELVCDGEELEDQRLINDICKNNDAVIHLLVRKSAKVRARPIQNDLEVSIEASKFFDNETNLVKKYKSVATEPQVIEKKLFPRDFLLEPLIVNSKIKLSLLIKEVINSTAKGLEKGNHPIRSSDGSGGTYLMQDSSGVNYVSVFKPIDEEPMAVNNPRGLPVSLDGEGLKKGACVGEGALREVAAYILDHPRSGPRTHWSYYEDRGFAGVPPTLMVKCLHGGFYHPEGYEYTSKCVKIGSLQMFVKNNGTCEDMGPRAFPVEEVHKISVLDIRLANADRHAGNILVCSDGKENKIMLVPIDHGYCLPKTVSMLTNLFLSLVN